MVNTTKRFEQVEFSFASPAKPAVQRPAVKEAKKFTPPILSALDPHEARQNAVLNIRLSQKTAFKKLSTPQDKIKFVKTLQAELALKKGVLDPVVASRSAILTLIS